MLQTNSFSIAQDPGYSVVIVIVATPAVLVLGGSGALIHWYATTNPVAGDNSLDCVNIVVAAFDRYSH